MANPPKFALVKSAIYPHFRRKVKAGTYGRRAPLTAEQRENMTNTWLDKKLKKQEAMSAWLAEIEAKASELVFEFGTSPQYWTQLLYKNGQRRVRMKSKVNAFNVFKVMKACSSYFVLVCVNVCFIDLLICKENEGKDTLMDLTEKYLAEYQGLSKEKKAKYIADFVQLCEENARPLTV
ncbi:hypothetical protein L218DRAFT_83577 [Marasmius fiardii PR-910]|nr:hypothetical protein L218DRAFT_83577 [Marasmius fiardii PR-910]